ncbi:hypothetical protein [Lewinella sp. IMCC34183]|uniref:hypothetical protein n=1 Tax=Lewinella sp. IMCC34183 TaxID=2248762 RepID=UPI0013001EC9|nr:hypothetical protein [Lewinella sp. IMCC34183]
MTFFRTRLLPFLLLAFLVACDKEDVSPAMPPPGAASTVCRITEMPYSISPWTTDSADVEYDTLRYSYADDGRLLTADLYGGQRVTFSYDGDRITEAVYTVPEYDLRFVGTYSYDGAGQLREVRYPDWYTSPRRGEHRLEVDSFFYDTDGRRTGMSTWAEVDDHLFTGYVPLVERTYEYDADGNIPRVVALEYYSDQYVGREANRRVTERTGFTPHRSLLYGSPLRDHHTYAISPFLHERETSVVTDPGGNRKSRSETNYVFTPEYIIPEGYYTWGRPYTCF